MNRYFLQFANKMSIHKNSFLGLGNGFSDTWDYCESIGDFIWVTQNYTSRITSRGTEECLMNKCPIENGVAYVSAINIMNMYQLYIWAKTNQNVKFIIGGPAVCTNLFSLKFPLPENMILVNESVEDFFGIDNFSYEWKLVPPKTDLEGIAFSYTIDTECYWGKCIFCGPHSSCTVRKRPENKFEFKDLNYKKDIFVRINTPSISPKQIRTLRSLPKFENIEYNLLIRGNEPESDEMEKLVKSTGGKLRFFLGVGIEFPSDRMYSYTNKGIKLNEIKRSIKKLSNLENVTLTLTTILGWDNLIESDILELEKFLDEIKNDKIQKIIIHRLKYPHMRKIHNSGKILEEVCVGPFYLGYFPKINRKQRKLNLKARKLFHCLDNVVDYYE